MRKILIISIVGGLLASTSALASERGDWLSSILANLSISSLMSVDGTGGKSVDGTGGKSVDGTGGKSADGTGGKSVDGTGQGTHSVDGTG